MEENHASTLNELLPAIQPCGLLHFAKNDVLIHSPGFEDRTLAIADVLGDVELGANSILLDYRPQNSANRLADVRTAFTAAGLSIPDANILAYDRFDPETFEAQLAARLTEENFSCVIVDISTMSKLAIMLVLNACCRLQLKVRVFYSEADSYAPSKEQFEDAKRNNKVHQPSLQIFTGIHGVVRVESLASVAMQGQPSAALVFMSFNDSLTQALLNTVYPSRLFLINGRPPVHDWREEATAWIHDQVRREWAEDNPLEQSSTLGMPLPKRVVSTFDYRETATLVLQLYWELSTNHRILLAPAGSKLQAIGCFLAKALHPDIHIEYPSPEGFFPNYSTGIGRKWILDLGHLHQLISTISTAERREYLEIPIGVAGSANS